MKESAASLGKFRSAGWGGLWVTSMLIFCGGIESENLISKLSFLDGGLLSVLGGFVPRVAFVVVKILYNIIW